MERLSDRQKQVLLKMRKSKNIAEQYHSFYLIYGQRHHIPRTLDYQTIAYYLYQNERKAIEKYYRNKLQQEKNEVQKVYYENICAFLKAFHQQQVGTYEYSKNQMAEKDRLFYEKQRVREQAQRQKQEQKKKNEQKKARKRNTFGSIVTSL